MEMRRQSDFEAYVNSSPTYDDSRQSVSLPNKKFVVQSKSAFDPSIVISAYTFSYLSSSFPNDGAGIKDKLNNEMNQVALLSALCLTIWMAILFNGYSGTTTVTGEPVEPYKLDVLVIILLTGSMFQALSMINAVFLSMIYGVCKSSADIIDLHSRIPTASQTPVLQFYVAVLIGIAGMMWFVNLPIL